MKVSVSLGRRANNVHPLMGDSECDILFSFYDLCLRDNFAYEQLLLLITVAGK